MLIGDKTGPAIIALTYGDVRPDHLLKQARRIRFTVQGQEAAEQVSRNESRNSTPDVSPCSMPVQEDVDTQEAAEAQCV